jgi:hypothetical protein
VAYPDVSIYRSQWHHRADGSAPALPLA